MAKKKSSTAENNQPLTELDADDKPNIRFWIAQHDAAKRAAENSLRQADDAWREYLGDRGYIAVSKSNVSVDEVEPRLPVFWASVRTIQPALYSRTPITQAQKMFESLDDNMARLASMSVERLSKYLMHDVPFDRVQYSTRDDFILAGKATNRVRIDSETKQTTRKEYYVQVEQEQPAQPQQDPSQMQPGMPPMPPPQPVMVWINNEGEPLQDPTQLRQDEEDPTQFYVEEMDEELDYICVELQPVSYKDIRHTPNARHWEEIDWISFKTLMTKPEVEKRFGEDIANTIPYNKHSMRKGATNKDKDDLLPTLYAEIWETWNKPRKEVYWHVEDWTDDFLDIQPDLFELDGFFPCAPFMLGTIGPDSLYPVPDYVQLKPMTRQLHAMAKRYQGLVAAIKRRGVADASIPELADLASKSEGDFVMVKNFAQQIVGKGGLENVVQFFPTQEYSQAITEISQAIEEYETKFNEIYGIPDILRGVSDPQETAAAQQLKGQYLSLRFSAIQREFQRLVRDGIELMIDLALKKFPQEKIAEIVGVRFWKQEDQGLWPQVYLLLRDDKERKVRIDIETDSTISMNQDAEIQRANFTAKTLMDGIASIGATEQQDPAFIAMAMNALLLVIGKIPNGKEFEQDLRKIKDAKVKEAEAPKPPPPPDPKIQVEQMKQQGKQQEIQAKGQLEQQKMAGQFQLKQAELQGQMQLEQVQAQSDIQTEITKVRAQIAQSQMESQQKMELEKILGAMEIQLKAMELNMKAKEHKMDMVHTHHDNQQSMALEKFKTEENIKLMNKKAEHAYEAEPNE